MAQHAGGTRDGGNGTETHTAQLGNLAVQVVQVLVVLRLEINVRRLLRLAPTPAPAGRIRMRQVCQKACSRQFERTT